MFIYLFYKQVTDWGLQVCKSIKIDILEAPQIKLDPPSVTLFRGASIRIRCLATQMNHVHDRLGYSWTKNHALFHSDPDIEMWEDLYPDGSILTIENIQKSATYSCAVSNPLAPVSSHVQVTVVDQETIIMCPENSSYGIKWPASSSGPPVLSDCPLNYNGQAQRFCEQRDYRKSEWLIPDFSDCINQDLIHISNEVILLYNTIIQSIVQFPKQMIPLHFQVFFFYVLIVRFLFFLSLK